MNTLIASNAIELELQRSVLAFYEDLLESIKDQFTEFQFASEYDYE